MPENSMNHYTKEELAHIVTELKRITVKDMSVFDATIINARTSQPIGLNQIRSSGMVYIKIKNWKSVGNLAVWVDVPEEPEN